MYPKLYTKSRNHINSQCSVGRFILQWVLWKRHIRTAWYSIFCKFLNITHVLSPIFLSNYVFTKNPVLPYAISVVWPLLNGNVNNCILHVYISPNNVRLPRYPYLVHTMVFRSEYKHDLWPNIVQYETFATLHYNDMVLNLYGFVLRLRFIQKQTSNM